MNKFSGVEIVKMLAANIANNNPPVDGDYMGEDGLLYCGKCQTRREMHMEMHGEVLTLPIMCSCREQKAEEQKQKDREAAVRQRMSELQRLCLMDSKLMSCRFENAEKGENDKSLRQCQRYAKKFAEMLADNRGLLLYGSVGTGKTHAAACIANELISHGRMAIMVSLVQIVDSDTEVFAEKICRADLVVFDDLGAERATDYALEKVYAAVDARYRSGKPVIYTTNLSLEELKHSENIRQARIYDRVLERCFPIAFLGVSRRKREARRGFEKMKELLDD